MINLKNWMSRGWLCSLTTSFVLLSVTAVASHAEEQRISLPMTLEYNLLNALVLDTFLGGGAPAGVNEARTHKTLFYEQDGCQAVVVTAPRFREQAGELLTEIQVHLRYGRSMGSYCVLPVTFNGTLVLKQIPVVRSEDWSLRFIPTGSEIQNLDGQPARLASLAWGLIENHVLQSMTDISINLAIPKDELQTFLTLVLPDDHPQEILEMLQGMQPGEVQVLAHGLKLENTMAAFDALYRPEPEPHGSFFSVEELEAFIAEWEAWDAFLVHMITVMAGQPLSEEEQWLLLDMLLRMRHEFSARLDDPVMHDDLVRSQFVEVWTTLGPLFRGHLMNAKSESLLGYFAFFSASDALLALNGLGSALDLVISRDGLLRLARLLDEGAEDLPGYGPEMIPELQRLLGLERQDSSARTSPRSWIIQTLELAAGFFSTSSARAESPPAELRDNLEHWLFRGKDLEGYMARVTRVLNKKANSVIAESKAPFAHQDYFQDLVLATAWLESCFRQFRLSGGEIMYLRSSNNTSVGIMQINERVWRGLYDQTRLRWDPAYNSRVGAEILDLYYTKYAQPRMSREAGKDWDPDLQAAMLYAMYNGGPSQLERFLTRKSENSLHRSDRLFREKWDWVRQGELDKISICLIGR
ncbi:Transglycosylase SLT domain-containing protein [Desulfonatronum thiosulfatophilum]|uniref:Transglycosylase SLT domain-containing protein n=1 Tax=Desulfonatronum thiosulfatophilum TaxID=617002 RepID=A0A1G6C9N7_9BACT|nr:lytic transglycosylase domain-containing protein [Desulfonatronum thiosulfatophilum]SDB29583.1 Transglycosylase SLT domain-containing protein [Desulfonatronum thiosulfatophilum]